MVNQTLFCNVYGSISVDLEVGRFVLADHCSCLILFADWFLYIENKNVFSSVFIYLPQLGVRSGKERPQVSIRTVFRIVEVSKSHVSVISMESTLRHIKWAPNEGGEWSSFPPFWVEVFWVSNCINLVVGPRFSVDQVRDSSFQGNVAALDSLVKHEFILCNKSEKIP